MARLCSVLFLAIAASQAVVGSDGPLRSSVAELEMRDHLGGSDSVAAHRGEVAVVMVVTAARLRNLKAWQRELQERIEGLHFMLVADVPRDPPVSFEQVASRLTQRVPAEVPVLIDLERRWATELGLDTARPNLLLFDRDGALVDRFHGRQDQETLEQVASRLEALVAE